MERDQAVAAVELYAQRLSQAIASVRLEQVCELAALLDATRLAGEQVLIIGNGGSASTASHMATDLGVGSDLLVPHLRAISLTDNQAVITATGNDRSFDEIYARQVRLLGRKGDVLIAISASGNSPNIVQAVADAKALGLVTVGITAFDGGQVREMSDLSIHVQTAKGDYGPAEDAHMMINHMVAQLLRGQLLGPNPDLAVKGQVS
ncbi:MAG: SIS domain-containing protein [Actinomycetota bacterium]|nr:SIS domain-containing protein [Actinomycetota bacterium]